MTEDQIRVLEGLRANDPHPERGEIKPTKDAFGDVYFERLTSSLRESWYDNGQMMSRCNYKGGSKEGLVEEYYANGQLCSRINYKDGKRDELSEWWYENG